MSCFLFYTLGIIILNFIQGDISEKTVSRFSFKSNDASACREMMKLVDQTIKKTFLLKSHFNNISWNN